MMQAIAVAIIKFTNMPLQLQQCYYKGCLNAVQRHWIDSSPTLELVQAMIVVEFERSGQEIDGVLSKLFALQPSMTECMESL